MEPALVLVWNLLERPLSRVYLSGEFGAGFQRKVVAEDLSDPCFPDALETAVPDRRPLSPQTSGRDLLPDKWRLLRARDSTSHTLRTFSLQLVEWKCAAHNQQDQRARFALAGAPLKCHLPPLASLLRQAAF